MTKEEVIEKIKDRLLRNAIKEYNNEVDRCGDYRTSEENRHIYDTRSQDLWTERVYLMQDYEDVLLGRFDELNFDYDS